MDTELKEAMTSGVLVEVHDAHGNVVAQAVYFDWRGRPLPGVGDFVSCDVTAAGAHGAERLRCRVRSRHFDLQRDEAGESSVWVRLVVEPASARDAAARRAVFQAAFSAN